MGRDGDQRLVFVVMFVAVFVVVFVAVFVAVFVVVFVAVFVVAGFPFVQDDTAGSPEGRHMNPAPS
jgi:hypothetical protein